MAGFVASMAKTFRKEGQTVQEFGNELKQLTRKDAADFVQWLNDAGIPTDEPPVTIKFAGE